MQVFPQETKNEQFLSISDLGLEEKMDRAVLMKFTKWRINELMKN